MCGGFVKDECKSFLRLNWPPALCFTVTFCWFSIFACIGVDALHDGILLKPATDVANGQMLFRDTFTQYGALTTFIQALAIKLFGPYLIVIRLTTVFFYSLSAVLLYYIWRNFLSPAFFWIMYGLFLVLFPFYALIFLPWSSVYALFFMLLANLCMLCFIKRGFVWLLCGVGVSSALAFWCRQPTGIVMYLALLLYFAVCLVLERKSWRRILINFGICTAAYVLCSMFFLVYLGLNGALADWYMQSIRFMFYSAKEAQTYLPPLSECLLPKSVFIVFPIASLSILSISLYSLFKRKSAVDREMNLMLIITAIIGLASWHQYFPVPDLQHYFWASIPMLGFYAFAVQSIVNIPIGEMPFNISIQLPRSSKLLLAVILTNIILIIVAIVGLAYWNHCFPVIGWGDPYWMAILILTLYAFAIQVIVSLSISDMPQSLSKPLTRLLKLLIAVILMMPAYGTAARMAKNVTDDFTSLSKRQVFDDSPLKYILLKDKEHRFFQSFRFVVAQIPPEFAGRPLINLTAIGFYPLYFQNGNNFCPMHVNWEKRVYPDYFDKVNRALAEGRSIVISYEKFEFPGYRMFALIENGKPEILFDLPEAKESPAKQVPDKGKKRDILEYAQFSSQFYPQFGMSLSMSLFFYVPDSENDKEYSH